MPEEKKITYIELTKFAIYVVTLIIAIMLFYGEMDKKVTIIQAEMAHKVDDTKLFERLDQLKEDLSRKIEIEIQKIKK